MAGIRKADVKLLETILKKGKALSGRLYAQEPSYKIDVVLEEVEDAVAGLELALKEALG